MIAVSEKPTDCPQRDAWLKAATYGHPPTDWEFYPQWVGLLVEIDKPDHLILMCNLCPEGATFDVIHDLTENKDCVRFSARLWPWETVPSIRGYGPFLFCHEIESLPMTTSSAIIKNLGGIP